MIKLIYPKFWSKNGVLSYLLIPFSWIYIFLGKVRTILVKPVKIDAKVICVGNMSVGGTGKTQIVLWLAKRLAQRKANFLVVTKGYGSSLRGAKLVEKTDLASEVGDESVLLSTYAPVLAAKNIKAALPIIAKLKPEIVIFDDGLQNPGFIKDLNILVIDANRAVGNRNIFPSGPLRESTKSALDKSDIIVMVGNDLCQDFTLINNIIANDKPLFKAKIKLKAQLDLSKRYYAFTAIGNPDRFYDLLKNQGATLAEVQSFSDHHNYTKLEIEALQVHAKQNKYSLITTKKDYVKIPKDDNVICADVVLDIDNEQNLFSFIYDKKN
ncbi:MAG: tetraacyldisaccharide 4'-kinase [Rickettsiaceae bacterium]|nr:tetraacyldisaccharide 4'-kinase [Rickettsiaceae bacterium]MDP4833047.1 tetraacyldisaccharide 4'-kinase [Rickettsiaceae bacterium]MDP5021001.1 tetraacyldisaccharide 4'-kinase [Rickettsiaceae bacterium]MDP5082670.1 tetraacyldisaccharide 4'-kinase [Rickettsiaceae bacterium]